MHIYETKHFRHRMSQDYTHLMSLLLCRFPTPTLMWGKFYANILYGQSIYKWKYTKLMSKSVPSAAKGINMALILLDEGTICMA